MPIHTANAKVNVEKIKKDINWDDKDLYNEARVNLEIAKRIQAENKRRKQLQGEGYDKQQIADILKKERENVNSNTLQGSKSVQAKVVKNNEDEDDDDKDEDEDTDDDGNSDFSSTKDGSIYYNKNSQEYKKPIITGDKEKKQSKNNEKVNTNNIKDTALNGQEKKSEPKKIVIEDEDDARDEYIYIKKKKRKPKTIVIEEEADDEGDYNVIHKKVQNVRSNKTNNSVSVENANSSIKAEQSNNEDIKKIPNIPNRSNIAGYNSIYQNQLTADDLSFLQMVNKTSKNMNNREHFNILAKELGKMARNINTGQQNYGSNAFYNTNQSNGFFDFYKYEKYNPSEMNENDNYNDYEDDEPVYKNRFVKQTSKKKQDNTYDVDRKVKKSKSKNEKPLMYASAIGIDNDEAILSQKTSSENDETDKINIKFLKQEGDGFLTDRYTKKQVEAKNIGAPYPILREKKDYMSQYNPYNISQVEYDKNNQHLQPAVFERQIIKDVFAHLKDNNSIEVVKALINKVGKTDIQDDDGNTILMHAVALKNQAMITMLLAEGANPNVINKDGFSPLHLASTNGDKVAIYYLMMGGGDPNLRDIDGNTSLMYASMTCGIDTLKMMISLGGDITLTNKANRNKNVLDYAKLNQDKKVYDFLQNTIERTKGTKSVNLIKG